MKNEILLHVEDLRVMVAGREVLKGINLVIRRGEVHVLLGPNGSGKSTLINALMGLSEYKVTHGRIKFLGEDITHMPIHKRVRMGMGMMFQRPPTVSGLTVNKLIKASFPRMSASVCAAAARRTDMENLLDREVNVGFSGGEMKRSECFQLLVQGPTFAMLDEPESGVDLENITLLGQAVRGLLGQGKAGSSIKGGLVITHTGHILDHCEATIGHIMMDGQLRCSGPPQHYLRLIRAVGYEQCASCDMEDMGEVCHTPGVEEEKDEPDHHVTIELLTEESAAETNRRRQRGTKNIGKAITISDLGGPINDVVDVKGVVTKEGTVGTVVVSGIEEEEGVEKEEETEVEGDYPRCGSYLQVDQDVVKANMMKEHEGIELLTLEEGLRRHPDLREKVFWHAVNPQKDEETRMVRAHEDEELRGYVIIAQEGVNATQPVDAYLLMKRNAAQFSHNLIIARKGATLHVASTCASCTVDHEDEAIGAGGTHYGVTEYLVEEGGSIYFSMVHNFCEKYTVYPRSAAVIEENGTFLSTYVNLNAVDKVQMYPTAHLVGKNAVARFSSVIVARPNTLFDLGSRAYLRAPGTKTEMVSRIISTGGKVFARAHVIGESEQTKGHVECQGLVLKKGTIHAIPEIEGCVEGTELSHEAAVGKIAQEKIEYLQSRGLSEDEAVATIIRGFLDVRVKGIPSTLQREIDRVIEQASAGGF